MTSSGGIVSPFSGHHDDSSRAENVHNSSSITTITTNNNSNNNAISKGTRGSEEDRVFICSLVLTLLLAIWVWYTWLSTSRRRRERQRAQEEAARKMIPKRPLNIIKAELHEHLKANKQLTTLTNDGILHDKTETNKEGPSFQKSQTGESTDSESSITIACSHIDIGANPSDGHGSDEEDLQSLRDVELGDFDGDGKIRLPDRSTPVRNICAICLEPYQVGDVVAFAQCVHAFHCDCIVGYLAFRARISAAAAKDFDCPCCRQPFVVGLEENSENTNEMPGER